MEGPLHEGSLSALGLLRALASSPTAAAATMRTRATTADTETAEDADEIGRATVLDLDDSEEAPDVVPGSDTGDSALGRRLRQLANDTDVLRGDADEKLLTGAKLIQGLPMTASVRCFSSLYRNCRVRR